MERIPTEIIYKSREHNGWPKCRVLVNDKVVHEFVAKETAEIFSFEVKSGNFSFTIQHYGKNMKKDINKFVEIKKLYFNDIDSKGLIWETVQKAEIPPWQKENNFNWNSNLYLGHNATLTWHLSSPIIPFFISYHQPQRKISGGLQFRDKNLLQNMKEYFEERLREKNDL
ncbi:MAG: hypothetical protein KYX68_10140 [Flavobacterium sp.]|nr:hypothetical protein [Flavobacterium sp.]